MSPELRTVLWIIGAFLLGGFLGAEGFGEGKEKTMRELVIHFLIGGIILAIAAASVAPRLFQ